MQFLFPRGPGPFSARDLAEAGLAREANRGAKRGLRSDWFWAKFLTGTVDGCELRLSRYPREKETTAEDINLRLVFVYVGESNHCGIEPQRLLEFTLGNRIGSRRVSEGWCEMDFDFKHPEYVNPWPSGDIYGTKLPGFLTEGIWDWLLKHPEG